MMDEIYKELETTLNSIKNPLEEDEDKNDGAIGNTVMIQTTN